MPVIAQRVAHVAKLAGGLTFTILACIGITPGLVSVVAARVTFEVAATLIVIARVFAHKALVACLSLDQCAVHAEVLAREPLFVFGDLQHFVEEFDNRVMLDQAFAVLGEDAWHSHVVIHEQANEP